MFRKIICLVLLIKLSTICESYVPVFFGHDSAVIVDTDKTVPQNKYNGVRFPAKIRMPPPFPLWRHYPRYHIIPAPPPGQILAINTWAKAAKTRVPFSPTTTTTTTTTSTTTSTTTARPTTLLPFLRDDEYPAELLDIAQNKLGLRSIEEIPSISELGQIVGTNSPEETLKYIKQLTLNEKGIALMKAYIESADYTDKTGELSSKNEVLENETEEDGGDDADVEEEDEDVEEDIEQLLNANDEGLIVVTDDDSTDENELTNEEELTQSNTPPAIQEMPENNQSLMGRLANYMHINSLFDKSEENDKNQINRITENGKKIGAQQEKMETKEIHDENNNSKTQTNNLKTPILVRDSIPYNYPIPLRIQTSTTTSTTLPPATDTPVVHLNTPKVLIPHVQQLSRVTKIPIKQIEDFVASKPKLLDLVTKVSRFPIGYDRNSPIEAQVVAAVQKAFKEDEDLKKLLSSAATLK